MQQGKYGDQVRLLHPDEVQRFKTFAIAYFERAEADGESAKLEAMFHGWSKARVSEADGRTLLAHVIGGALEKSPESAQALADLNLDLLGEVKEGEDLHHVIGRLLFRAEVFTCIRYKGRWMLALSREQSSLVNAFEQLEHFRKQGLAEDEQRRQMLDIRLDDVKVLGVVPDGDNTAHAICRFQARTGDYVIEQIGAYPIRRGEPAWGLQGEDQRRELAEVLKEKWERMKSG